MFTVLAWFIWPHTDFVFLGWFVHLYNLTDILFYLLLYLSFCFKFALDPDLVCLMTVERGNLGTRVLIMELILFIQK